MGAICPGSLESEAGRIALLMVSACLLAPGVLASFEGDSVQLSLAAATALLRTI